VTTKLTTFSKDGNWRGKRRIPPTAVVHVRYVLQDVDWGNTNH